MFEFNKKEKNSWKEKDIKKVLKEFEELKKEFEKVSLGLQKMKEENKMSIQKVGIIRYNPFSNTGSDLSFSIALLDGANNGIVITSLYSREGNRVYGKDVEKGISQYSLSKEESEIIKKAINNGRK
ncbi:MAG: DUF4446 family protein [Nanoarchaeota archaeon]|nr:DUF4446 family protein [Patescibacteria group bacterium]MBU4124629.1 DUF4446 family protein [Nanoarchaeota archaeon]